MMNVFMPNLFDLRSGDGENRSSCYEANVRKKFPTPF